MNQSSGSNTTRNVLERTSTEVSSLSTEEEGTIVTVVIVVIVIIICIIILFTLGIFIDCRTQKAEQTEKSGKRYRRKLNLPKMSFANRANAKEDSKCFASDMYPTASTSSFPYTVESV